VNQVQQLWRRPLGKVIAGVAVLAVIGLVVGGDYVFGGGSPAHNKLTTAACTTASGQTAFSIDDSASSVSFTIDEVLFGNPNTVVGKTNQVSGQVNIDKTDAAKSAICPIKVDLSTLKTDNDLRNSAIQGRIFETSDPSNQFATIETTAMGGLPSTAVALGQTVTFTITGDLTLHGATRSETFAATVTATSETAITGSAKATVPYADFGLAIPNVPSVTDVGDAVTLEIDFTAEA
jgi:polyisoprenoid-binding protein YceI